VEWLILAVATLLAFIPNFGTAAAALALFAVVYLWQRKRVSAQLQTGQSAEITAK
jgi:hypothetical protein